MTRKITAAAYVNAKNRAHRGSKGRVRGAKPEVVDSIRFASRLEARRWKLLSALASTGQITDLRRQVSMVLQGRDGPVLTPTGRPMRYVADFVYRDAIALEDALGNYPVTRLLERRRVTAGASGDTICGIAHAAIISKETSEAVVSILAAEQSDSAGDRAQAITEIDEAIAALTAARERLQRAGT